MTAAGWKVVRTGPATVHVSPLVDHIEHTLADDCACGPRVVPEKRPDGSVGWICVHHSLDGRETEETPR